MFDWLGNWKPVRKIAAVIMAAIVTGITALLNYLEVYDWQGNLAEDLGPWAFPIAIAVGAIVGFIRKSLPDSGEEAPPEP